MMGKIKALWILGRPLWLCLFSGYFIVVFSYIFTSRFTSSGAALICAAILAQLAYSRFNWIRHKTVTMGIKNGSPIADNFAKIEYVWVFARQNEIKPNGWLLTSTINRITFSMTLAIAASTIIGTVIWGYGDLLVN